MPGNRERVFPDSSVVERVLEIWDDTARQLDPSNEEKAMLWVIPLNGATAYGYPDFYLDDWNNFEALHTPLTNLQKRHNDDIITS